ncbi:MAG TPA: amidohydrolase family protein [Saprospiraceae bacterium]|nr:amidohydrolase family protein [Saprospiraceae bacterium]
MKKNSFILVLFTFVQSIFVLQAQQVEKSTYGVFALTNAKVETVTKGKLENATVIIRNGKIEAVGTNVTIPADAQVIDCKGLTIYPGMVDSGTHLGLQEIESISVTQDYDEIGEISPEMQALTAVNPNSVLIPVARVSGVTSVISYPSGGLFPGTAALINLQGYTPEQMYAGFKAVVMNFPMSGRRGRYDRRTDEEVKKDSDKAIKKLNDTWERVKTYAAIDSSTNGKADYNPQMAALVPVFRGKATAMIEVNKETDILSALKWIKENKIKAILTGVSEGWRVADSIALSGVPVITGPVISQPTRASDRYDQGYKNAGIMQKAGVKVALRTDDAENVRNLPFNAGFAATYGMGQDDALKAVTIVPAEIFGVADRIGSIEVGKEANIFVSTGDPFEPATQLKHLFINGWNVPLESRQTLLYEEFLKRSPGVTKENVPGKS